MPKKPSLAAALKADEPEVVSPQPEKKEDKPSSGRTSYVAPSREGKKAVSGYFDPGVSKQLKLICLEQDTNLQALLKEALNDLFVKHGKSPIA